MVIMVGLMLVYKDLKTSIEAEKEIMRIAHNGFYNPFWSTPTENSFMFKAVFTGCYLSFFGIVISVCNMLGLAEM